MLFSFASNSDFGIQLQNQLMNGARGKLEPIALPRLADVSNNIDERRVSRAKSTSTDMAANKQYFFT